jgi:hypothetical protein
MAPEDVSSPPAFVSSDDRVAMECSESQGQLVIRRYREDCRVGQNMYFEITNCQQAHEQF